MAKRANDGTRGNGIEWDGEVPCGRYYFPTATARPLTVGLSLVCTCRAYLLLPPSGSEILIRLSFIPVHEPSQTATNSFSEFTLPHPLSLSSQMQMKFRIILVIAFSICGGTPCEELGVASYHCLVSSHIALGACSSSFVF